jgi:hypothetical protein
MTGYTVNVLDWDMLSIADVIVENKSKGLVIRAIASKQTHQQKKGARDDTRGQMPFSKSYLSYLPYLMSLTVSVYTFLSLLSAL